MLYLGLKALHLLGLILWVGGMMFAHFFLRPALGALPPPQRLALMHEVLRRFFGAVTVALVLILASGLWMIHGVASAIVQAGGRFEWPLDWLLMTAVGVLMMAIFGHIRWVLFRRFGGAVKAAAWAEAGAVLASIRQWVAVNLGLGVALVVAVVLL
jgi:uncharacterized membrane protein